MKAARIHQFGSPDVIVIDVPCPTPSRRQVIVRVAAAGVGPWDALCHGASPVGSRLAVAVSYRAACPHPGRTLTGWSM
jgi:NADPH:quinone reductase-like Zn-dependent oxidoreductase